MKKKKRVPKFLQAMMATQPPFSTCAERVLSREETSVQKEVDYILQRARAGASCVVGFGPLVLFSTHTRDAWMLDWQDEFAICLTKDGVARAYELGETGRRFAIQWQGRYHIEGQLFAYIDDETPTHPQVMGGYPTDAIRRTVARLQQAN